ncbi:MAG: DUF167 domain-containing protein [Verrucomicrobia bacterium]|nr:DUF167 domain-containing protein [Verrucomicrobiota bacterium]
MIPSYLKDCASGCTLSVRLQPRASRNEICGEMGDSLKIKVTAPPVDSAANSLLIEFIADLLHISKGSVQILKGHTSRNKILQITGVTSSDFLSKIKKS